tara:strand:- start:1511 stop:2068 length:558 start_codon:yes stop_codon:yes gene_type:complete
MNPETFVMVCKFNCIYETIEIQHAYTFFEKKKKLQVMTHNGYAPIQNITKTDYNGNMFRIHCNRGIVEVSESTNLVTESLDLVYPLNSQEKILTHVPLKMDQSLSRRNCCTFSRKAAEWQFQNIVNPTILIDKNNKYHVESASSDIENKVFLVEQIPNISKIIYSIDIENEFHQAGIGNLIIKTP